MSFSFFQYDEAIYLSDCAILGRFLSRSGVGGGGDWLFTNSIIFIVTATHTSCLKYILKN